METFTPAEEFIKRPREFNPSCLVLDISMPGLNRLELQKRLARWNDPTCQLSLLTGSADVPKTVKQ